MGFEIEGIQNIGLIRCNMEDRLNEGCKKIIKWHVYRVVVVDQNTKMITGIISQKDILVFLIKGFSQYFNDVNLAKKVRKADQDKNESEQHELQIRFFFETEMKPKLAYEYHHQSVYQ